MCTHTHRHTHTHAHTHRHGRTRTWTSCVRQFRATPWSSPSRLTPPLSRSVCVCVCVFVCVYVCVCACICVFVCVHETVQGYTMIQHKSIDSTTQQVCVFMYVEKCVCLCVRVSICTCLCVCVCVCVFVCVGWSVRPWWTQKTSATLTHPLFLCVCLRMCRAVCTSSTALRSSLPIRWAVRLKGTQSRLLNSPHN